MCVQCPAKVFIFKWLLRGESNVLLMCVFNPSVLTMCVNGVLLKCVTNLTYNGRTFNLNKILKMSFQICCPANVCK